MNLLFTVLLFNLHISTTCNEHIFMELPDIYSPVYLEFDLEKIATKMTFAESNSLNSAS